MSNSLKTNSPISFQLDEFYSELREDGRSVNFIEKKEIENRPFPGLRPFKTSEFQLFNGRDGQAEELINRLKTNHFLAVIGSSGTGKSSLIRAGLIPQLLAGYLHEAGTNWDIAICRPGKNPVENLAVALARTKCRSNSQGDLLNEYYLINPLLNRSQYGILDVNELLNPPEKPEEKSNLLIIIDQFEELFRFNRSDLKKPDLENHFVNLLLSASSKPETSIYVIITMRSEFLGDCVKYRGLPETINQGQYLVPQLNRSQIKEVIEDPIIMAGKKITPGLVELLVNEIEESKSKQDLDQLPILQHALMRTYQEAMKAGNKSEIKYEHYKAAGGLENALANHAESKYTELSDGTNKESPNQKLAKLIFQALTDASGDKKGGRRPTELKNIYAIVSSIATEQEVDQVINHFRDTETSFIMPPANTKLFPDLFMDISHESLMRQWKTLKDWVSEEAESAKYYLRLVDSAYQHSTVDVNGNTKKEEKGLLADSELHTALEWKEKYNPTAAWSKRYNDSFKKCMDYLEDSVKESNSKNNAEIKRKRRLKWLKNSLIIVSILFGITVSWIAVDIKSEKKKLDHWRNTDIVSYKKTIENLQNTLKMKDSIQKEKDLLMNHYIRDTLEWKRKINKLQVQKVKPTIGSYYEGGNVFYIDNSGEHGLIVSVTDLNNGYESGWNEAIELCMAFVTDGKNGWYLPSLEELKMLYNQRDYIGGLKDELYWSSNVYPEKSQAYLMNFSNGYTSYHYNKNRKFYVRAVRRF